MGFLLEDHPVASLERRAKNESLADQAADFLQEALRRVGAALRAGFRTALKPRHVLCSTVLGALATGRITEGPFGRSQKLHQPTLSRDVTEILPEPHGYMQALMLALMRLLPWCRNDEVVGGFGAVGWNGKPWR